jgi:hypothetical protein
LRLDTLDARLADVAKRVVGREPGAFADNLDPIGDAGVEEGDALVPGFSLAGEADLDGIARFGIQGYWFADIESQRFLLPY